MSINELHGHNGKFTLDDHFIRTRPNDVMQILGNMIVYHAEYNMAHRHMTYEAFSPLFEYNHSHPMYWYSVDVSMGEVVVEKLDKCYTCDRPFY